MNHDYRKTIPWIAIGMFVSTLAFQANADDRKLDRMTHRLGLSTEQVEAIRYLNEQTDRPDRSAARQEVQALIETGQVDAAADLAASNARELTYKRVEHMTTMSEILTPDQFEEWSSRGERRPCGRGRGGRAQQSTEGEKP